MRTVVVALLLVAHLGACTPDHSAVPPSAQEAVPWVLHFESDPSSENFGTLALRPENPPLSLASWESVQEESLQETFAVWTGDADLPADSCLHPTKQPTMLGRVRFGSHGLEFQPRLGYATGMTYTACVDGAALARAFSEPWQPPFTTEQLVFTTPVNTSKPPRVTAVWPLTNSMLLPQQALTTVPENLLRLYILFSESMEARGVSDKIKLVDPAGDPISDAFVAIPNGLWDADLTRLTLFLHPGRLKRGLGPRKRLGPILETGATIHLLIEGSLRSQEGQPLGEDVVVPFTVGPADRRSPDPDQWRVQSPDTPSGPVTVFFDEPLDRAQLLTFASVLDEEGEVLDGSSSHAANGRSWSFVPAQIWQQGPHRITAKSSVEDLAGNSPRRLFDTETEQNTPTKPVGTTAPSTSGEPIEMVFSPLGFQ